MMTSFKRFRVSLACGAVLLLAACTQVRNPATGELQYTSLTPAEEIALGRSEDPKVRAEFGGEYDNPAITSYIDGIGQRLKAQSELPDLEFTFTVLDSPVVNAFALPGGYVYISRGLLALAENEAEVAGVVGHEIGHVTARHTAQRYDRQQTSSILTNVAGVAGTLLGAYFGGEAGAKAGGQVASQAVGLGGAAWVKGFSREQEFHADELGVRYLARLNYDPRGMSSFLAALQSNDRLQQKKTGGKSANAMPDWLSSHPRTADRVERAANEAASSLSNGGALKRDRLLDTIDGMTYGDGRKQGFIIGSRFAHPIEQFEFSVPDGMRLVNNPSNILAVKENTLRMRFEFGESDSADFEGYLRKLTKDAIQDVEPIRINGRNGAEGRLSIKRDGRTYDVMLAALDGPGSRIYQFMFVSQGSMSASQRQENMAILNSLKDLSQQEADKLKPLRIKVVTIKPGQGVDDFANMMAVKDHKRDLFIAMNALDRGRQLKAGERVKIVVR